MNYAETLDYMFAQLPMYQRVGSTAHKKDLTNIRQLCQAIDDPQDKFPSIHIAGTNGKGSTAHILAAILQARGYTVGLYTSPHYQDFRERIKINGTFIEEQAVIEFIAQNKTLFEAIKPSFFEMTVAMAFNYFAEKKVDFAVIETGLGGRLDSTNILHPILSIITNISYDHQQFLGNTLAAIAGEKAGIIKQDTPVVVGETHEETRPVFEERANEMNAPIYFADEHYKTFFLGQIENSQLFRIVKNDKLLYRKIDLNLLGSFQSKNLATVLQAIEIFDGLYSMKKDILKNSVLLGAHQVRESTRFIGRWEILGQTPMIIADSAHNEAGIASAMTELKRQVFQKMHIILGAVNDKDLSKIFPFFPEDATYYFAKPNVPRGLAAESIATKASNFGLIGDSYASVNEAFVAAKKNATKEDLIYIGGSIFVVAEVL